MITCQLIQISHNQHGVSVHSESTVSGELIQIGRGANCKIHLQDHRVDLHQASLKRSEDGTIFIVVERDSTIHINGYIEDSGALTIGTRVEVGPYLLVVEAKDDAHDIAFSIECIQPATKESDALTSAKDYLTISSVGLSKRRIGLGLSIAILILYLLLPMLPSFSSAIDNWQFSLPVTMTGSWSPGELSGGHRTFGAKCSSCHQDAFKEVKDEACKSCHKKIIHHVSDKVLHDREFKNIRCTSCHDDHKGSKGLIRHDSSLCVKCHQDILSVKVSSRLANVRDFSKDHPPFRLKLLDGKELGSAHLVRQKPNEVIEESPMLKYSHKIHLNPKGVSSPSGDIVMTCPDCHKTDEAGNHFAPMTMKNTCQQSGCHSLYFEAPAEGRVPHGSEHEVMSRLRDFYTKWLAQSPANRSSCRNFDGADCASSLAKENAAKSLFNPNAGCIDCHEIESTNDLENPWLITPLRINRDWHTGAAFSHVKHGAVACESCHDKMSSKLSKDVSMPSIDKCRECHIGEATARGKITSYCDSCHKFHKAK